MTTETIPTASSPRAGSQLEQLAWVIMLVSFVLFCSSSLAITGGIYYFFFRSYVPMDVYVEVSRGTAGLVASDFTEQIVRSGSTTNFNVATRPSLVTTDAQSQATLSFEIVDSDNQPHNIASVTLENSTSLRMLTSRRPRFDWTTGQYTVEIAQLVGEADVYIASALDRPIRFTFDFNGGTQVIITDPGRYSLENIDSVLRVTARQGRVAVISSDRRNNRLVTAGEMAIMRIGGTIPVISQAPVDVLENGIFSFDAVLDPSGVADILPERWGCFDLPESAPSGRYLTALWQGRPALRLVRADNAASHGQTGCVQELNIDVRSYSYIELQTSFLISNQSLSTCGFDGSECPIMVFIYYEDINGVARQWYQGFYYNQQQGVTYPALCTTCGQVYEHRQISDQVWYTYKTSNLFSRFSASERPARINRIVFYASGHQYDVYVSEMLFLVGSEEVIPPTINTVPNG